MKKRAARLPAGVEAFGWITRGKLLVPPHLTIMSFLPLYKKFSAVPQICNVCFCNHDGECTTNTNFRG